MNYIKVGLIVAFMLWVLFSIGNADAETETTVDVTEKSAGATHESVSYTHLRAHET